MLVSLLLWSEALRGFPLRETLSGPEKLCCSTESEECLFFCSAFVTEAVIFCYYFKDINEILLI